jgi:hypothetical protein
MNMLSLGQLCGRLPLTRHLCKVCCARHVCTRARHGHVLRSHRFPGHAARLSSSNSRLSWQQCTASAADPATAAGVANQERQAGGAAHAAEAKQGPSFQDAIAALQAYWSGKGCAVCLPHNTEVWLHE